METLSQLLKQTPSTMATVGQIENVRDHVTIVTSSVGVTWNGLSDQFAIDAGILLPDFQRPYGYIHRQTGKWVCRIWKGGAWLHYFDNASDEEFERYAKFIPPSILLVAMEDVDDVVHTLLRSGHSCVSGVCMSTIIYSK